MDGGRPVGYTAILAIREMSYAQEDALTKRQIGRAQT
jgi:hypothetical protein